MISKTELIDSVEHNTRKKYLYSIVKLSTVFFFVAMVSSYFGLTTMSTDLGIISDNTFLAHVTFIGFIILINERIIEAFKRTFRRRTSNEYLNELSRVKDELAANPTDPDLKDRVRIWTSVVNDYSAETGRMCLVASLIVGCSLASVGAVRILGGLEDSTQFANSLHIMLFDSIDVVLTGWVVSGGSEGWTNFLHNVKSLLPDTAK
ncbi:hypothetical protein F2P58_20690 [Vibrio fortis]|uniref:Uncharacterized protein n=1 Tax=Vibrio fortis TaxID=212667 RepID=A0A5N3QY28_9VIBR|nr:hypothetical protein [Vibrio fortis]KAB0287049.1 hypothetical protein F2P58_20690 [Vibrio fortis]